MDSRDIHIEVPSIPQEEFLPKIFDLQKELIEDYIKIEKGKPYPVNVNTKESQVMLKDFTSRIIEELAEGYESLLLVDELFRKNGYKAYEGNGSEYLQILNHLQNANEEFADAIHFMVELLIYLNIDVESITSYLKYKYPEHIEESILPDPLIDIQKVGMYFIVKELNGPDVMPVAPLVGFDLLRPINKGWLSDSIMKGIDINLLKGGSNYNASEYLHSYREILWSITYHLNISRNFLRNKPWKQSQVFVNEQAYQEEVINSFIYLMGFLAYLGLTPKDIFYIYYKKNQVNRFRIKSKY